MNCRLENEGDKEEIHRLLSTSFPSNGEALLVDSLRDANDIVFSLVAEIDGEIVGHVLFSKMSAPFLALA